MLDALEGARENVLHRVARLPTGATGEDTRDLYNAAAALGRVMAEVSASKVLVAETLDGLCDVADLGHPPWLAGAKAALLEGFMAVAEARAGARERARWQLPVVDLGGGRVAIYAAYEDEDDAETREWADRLVAKLAKGGTRSMVLGGRPKALKALRDAAEVAGVATTSEAEAASAPPSPPSPAPPGKRRFWPFG
jgi:hypothetical protein